MISASNISLAYGKRTIFKNVNIKFTPGNCYGLIGANGAGKTSMLRTISWLLRPKSGRILYKPHSDGEEIDISRVSAEQIVALGISHCPEGRGIFSRLSVRENLMVGSSLRKNKKMALQI